MRLSRVILASVVLAGCGGDSKSLSGPDTEPTGSTGGEQVPQAVTCEPSCREIRAYPADLERNCVDTEVAVVVGCDCNPNFGGAPGCVRWKDDGSLWMAENTDDLMWDENSGEPATPLDTGWVHCADDEWQRTRFACDFEGCIAAPSSRCSAVDTCETLQGSWGIRCGDIAGPYDEDGCSRPSCESDANCGAGQACLVVECGIGPSCVYEVEALCVCSDNPTCRPQSYCVDEAIAGAWTAFEIHRGAGPCAPGGICEWLWTVDPSGGVSTSKAGEPGEAQLTASDLELLAIIVGSPQFRTNMAQGFACGEPPTDVSVSFRLKLPAGDLTQDVTGCVVGDDGSQAGTIFELLSKY